MSKSDYQSIGAATSSTTVGIPTTTTGNKNSRTGPIETQGGIDQDGHYTRRSDQTIPISTIFAQGMTTPTNISKEAAMYQNSSNCSCRARRKTIQRIISSSVTKDFLVKKSEGSNQQILCKNKDESATKDLLVKNQGKFCTQTLPSEKTTYTPQEIADDLWCQAISSVLFIKRFVSTKATQETVD